MPRVLLLALVLPAFAVAAPVPKASDERLRQLFGEPTDPDKDCKFELDGKKLRITVPATAHRLDADHKLGNAPRVVREVTGDFSAQVRVRLVPSEVPSPPAGQASPVFNAGLLVAADAEGFAYHGYSRIVTTRREFFQLGSGVRLDTGFRTSIGGGVPNNEAPLGALILRVVRTGGKLRMDSWTEVQPDKWPTLHTQDVNFPKTVTVGLFAAHNAKFPFTAEFDDFSIRPLKDGP